MVSGASLTILNGLIGEKEGVPILWSAARRELFKICALKSDDFDKAVREINGFSKLSASDQNKAPQGAAVLLAIANDIMHPDGHILMAGASPAVAMAMSAVRRMRPGFRCEFIYRL